MRNRDVQVAEERKRALETAIKEIKKQYGEGAIMRLGDRKGLAVEVIPTGFISLDYALGVGGLPRGRIVEIFGPEASGKTTVALHAIAMAQRMGEAAAFIDAEHALDPIYAKKLGVNVGDLFISQPDYGEQALEIAEILVRSGSVGIVVIDSVAALVPKAELEGEMEDHQVGLQARLMSKALRKLAGAISKTKTVVIFINQLREKVSMGFGFGGPSEITPGGRALKFYASVRLEVKRREQIKKGTDVLGCFVEVKVVKNKVAPPFRSALLEMYYGEGFSREADLLNLGERLGIVKRSGAWYSYGDKKLGQGKEAAREFLKTHSDVAEEIERKIKEALGMSFPARNQGSQGGKETSSRQ